MYNVLKIVLVVGNRKYLTESTKTQKFSHRLEFFVKMLTSVNRNKFIYIGVDQIFKTAGNIMNRYLNTKAVFLLTPNIKDELSKFSNFDKDRLVIYALQIHSKRDGLKKDYIKNYLMRRGEKISNFYQNISMYSIIQNIPKGQQYINYSEYSWFLFEN